MSGTVILGGGPTGLGAAYRLRERGEDRFEIFERSDRVVAADEGLEPSRVDLGHTGRGTAGAPHRESNIHRQRVVIREIEVDESA